MIKYLKIKVRVHHGIRGWGKQKGLVTSVSFLNTGDIAPGIKTLRIILKPVLMQCHLT